MNETTTYISTINMRKIVQETIKPIIMEIENQINAIKGVQEVVQRHNQSMHQIQNKQSEIEKNAKNQQSNIKAIKCQINEIKQAQSYKNRQMQCKYDEISQQLRQIPAINTKNNHFCTKLKKQSQNIQYMTDKYQSWVEQKMINLDISFNKLTNDTLCVAEQIKHKYEESKNTMIQYQKESDGRYERQKEKMNIIDLYMVERQQRMEQMLALRQQMANYVTQQQNAYLDTCQNKQIDNLMKKVLNTLEEYFPEPIRQQMPLLNEKLMSMQQLEQEIKRMKQKSIEVDVDLQRLWQSIRKINKMKQKQDVIMTNKIEGLKQELQKVCKFQKTLNLQKQTLKTIFMDQTRVYVAKQLDSLYNEIKSNMTDQYAELKKQQLEKIAQQREKMSEKTKYIEQLSDNINTILKNYSSRITTFKSDVQLMLGDVNKQLKRIVKFKMDAEINFKQLGVVLSYIYQVIILSSTLQIHEKLPISKQCSFVTYNDGLIYKKQSTRLHNRERITYRNKNMMVLGLQQSMLNSLVGFVDEICTSKNLGFLQWQNSKPSKFFHTNICLNYYAYQQAVSSCRKYQKELQFTDTLEEQNQNKVYWKNQKSNLKNSKEIKTTIALDSSRKNSFKSRTRKSRYNEQQCFTAKNGHRTNRSLFIN